MDKNRFELIQLGNKEQKAWKEVLVRRNIRSFIHFTRADNLTGILKYGVLPVQTMKESGIPYRNNDEVRLDNHEDAVSVSVSFPNYRMFYRKRNKYTQCNWVVLELNPEAVLDNRCMFFETNAANKRMLSAQTSGGECMGDAKAFEAMFSENAMGTRSRMNLPPHYTTDSQAEILVFGCIPVKAIKVVYFDSEAQFKKHKDLLAALGIAASTDRRYFGNREDYKGAINYGYQTSVS